MVVFILYSGAIQVKFDTTKNFKLDEDLKTREVKYLKYNLIPGFSAWCVGKIGDEICGVTTDYDWLKTLTYKQLLNLFVACRDLDLPNCLQQTYNYLSQVDVSKLKTKNLNKSEREKLCALLKK